MSHRLEADPLRRLGRSRNRCQRISPDNRLSLIRRDASTRAPQKATERGLALPANGYIEPRNEVYGPSNESIGPCARWPDLPAASSGFPKTSSGCPTSLPSLSSSSSSLPKTFSDPPRISPSVLRTGARGSVRCQSTSTGLQIEHHPEGRVDSLEPFLVDERREVPERPDLGVHRDDLVRLDPMGLGFPVLVDQP